MEQAQFNDFVDAIIRKNKKISALYSTKEVYGECWAAVAQGIENWDGSKGKLNSWVYTAVIGRMKDLGKAQKKNYRVVTPLPYQAEEIIFQKTTKGIS